MLKRNRAKKGLSMNSRIYEGGGWQIKKAPKQNVE